MQSGYIEQRSGGYYVAGTCISLDSVVYSFHRGNSPEGVKEQYPLLRLAQIYGAIAFYLDHKVQIDEYLAESRREFGAHTIPLQEENPGLWERLQRARARMSESNI